MSMKITWNSSPSSKALQMLSYKTDNWLTVESLGKDPDWWGGGGGGGLWKSSILEEN